MKKSITNSLPREDNPSGQRRARAVKCLILSRGPGETGQARALGKYLAKEGKKIVFCLKEKRNLFFLKNDKEFKIFLTENPAKLKEVLKKEKPEVFLIFNSKIWADNPVFQKKPAFKKPLICLSLDSNWLFDQKEYPQHPPLPWLDRYLVVFPKKIFELGLKEQGGDFKISQPILRKIIPVGFIPSYQKPSPKVKLKIRTDYRIKRQEKLIFAYFSGFGAGYRFWAFENLRKAVGLLIKKGCKIKTLYVGPRENLGLEKGTRDWLIIKESLPSEDYFKTLASCDLVFQHQGLATLSQAIAAQIPVIANVALLKGEEKLLKLHFWEVRPFVRAGTCALFSKSTPIKRISQKIEELLYNAAARKKMQNSQKAIFEKGEKKVSDIINDLLGV